MIKATYDQDSRDYMLRLENCDINDKTFISLKFDTGANATVIGICQIFKMLSTRDHEELIALLNKYGCSKQRFSSASGESIVGYLTKLSNVKLSGEDIKDFYFYLITSRIDKTGKEVRYKSSTALLGADFIQYCDFVHNIGSDIIINKVDEALISKNFSLDYKVFELNELMVEYIIEDTDTKNIAAAFRMLYDKK